MANSSSGKLLARLVEIEVKSATLNSTDKRGSFYVRVSVSEDQGLRTKLVNCSMDYSPSWNQKFVFSVPRNFIAADGKSAVCFTVLKARKYMPDLSMGQAMCDVGAMFPVHECMKEDGSSYHTDDDREYHYEPEIQERETFEVRAVVGVPILKGEAETGKLHLSICAWEGYYPYELNLNGRLKKTYPIIKGSDKLGRLIMQRASSQDKYLWFEGKMKVRNLAMEHEEFMTQREIDQKKQHPKRSTLCFAS